MSARKVTLSDIAKKANVSTALVSCILNGKGRASERVRNKVLALLDEAGYRPKYTRKSFYLLADLDRIAESGKSIPFMRMIRGIEATLDEEGIHLQVEFLSSPEQNSAKGLTVQFEAVAERQPGAVFVATDESWLDRACAFFSGRGIPLMQIGYDTENARYPAVVVDSFAGARAAVRELIERGHHRIAVLRWLWNLSAVNSTNKFAGFKAGLADAGLELRPEYVREIRTSWRENGYTPARSDVEALLALPEPPTALFVDNSGISLSLLYPVPEDRGAVPDAVRSLDTIHFEDWPLDPVEDTLVHKLFHASRCTSVLAIDWEAIGRIASRLLVEQVRNGGTAAPSAIRVAPVLQRLEGRKRTPLNDTTHSSTGDTP